jgi:hypothetical protein
MEFRNLTIKDSTFVGFGAGILGTAMGFTLFMSVFCLFNDVSIEFFIYDFFLAIPDFQSRILSFSALVNVVFFAMMLKKEKYQFCRGLMLALVMNVIAVIWLY